MKRNIYNIRRTLMLLTAVSLGHVASAQVGVGTATPHPSAQLEIVAEDKGLLIPRVTSVSVIVEPAKGLMVYQTGDTAGFYYNKGTSANPDWTRIADASSNAGVADGSITNAKVASNAAIAYSKLALTNSIVNDDLTAGSVSTSKLLDGTVTSAKIFDGTIVNADVSPTAAIAYSKLNLAGSIVASDIDGSSATSGQVLRYNGTSVGWGAVSGTPSGAAGGDLTGTYPNPTIANSTITSAKILDGVIVNSDVSATANIAYSKLNLLGSITGSDITDATITAQKIAPAGASNGQVLGYSSTTGVGWVTPSSGGGSGFDKRYGVAQNTTSGVIAVVLGGTNVPLPDNQFLSEGINVNGANDQFTLVDAGIYKVSYSLSTQSALLLGSRILLNGMPLPASIDEASVAKDHFSGTMIFNAIPNSSISLQLFSLLGAATLNGQCMMSIEKIDEQQP